MTFTMAASSYGPVKSGNLPFQIGIVISIAFHVLTLVGVPLFLRLAQRSVRFERPATFQLVSAPPSLRPFKPAQRLSRQRPRETVKKDAARRVPGESAPVEENIDELASMLDELPSPARVAGAGDTKFNPYYAEVQQKIERYWTPSMENRNLMVVVAFTIFADGSISNPVIEKSSGDGSLDDMALRAVRLAAPFSKLPLSIAADKKDVTCTLRPVRR